MALERLVDMYHVHSDSSVIIRCCIHVQFPIATGIISSSPGRDFLQSGSFFFLPATPLCVYDPNVTKYWRSIVWGHLLLFQMVSFVAGVWFKSTHTVARERRSWAAVDTVNLFSWLIRHENKQVKGPKANLIQFWPPFGLDPVQMLWCRPYVFCHGAIFVWHF